MATIPSRTALDSDDEDRFVKLDRPLVYQTIREMLPIKIHDVSTIRGHVIVSSPVEKITMDDLVKLMPTTDNYSDNSISSDFIDWQLNLVKEANGSTLPVKSRVAALVINNDYPAGATLQSVLDTQDSNNEIKCNPHLWPINVEQHWVMVVVNYAQKLFSVYDANNKPQLYMTAARTIARWYASADPKFRTNQACFVPMAHAACEKNDGSNCGVFLLMKAAELAGCVQEMSYEDYRTHLTAEVLLMRALSPKPSRSDIPLIRRRLQKLERELIDEFPPRKLFSRREIERIGTQAERAKKGKEYADFETLVQMVEDKLPKILRLYDTLKIEKAYESYLIFNKPLEADEGESKSNQTMGAQIKKKTKRPIEPAQETASGTKNQPMRKKRRLKKGPASQSDGSSVNDDSSDEEAPEPQEPFGKRKQEWADNENNKNQTFPPWVNDYFKGAVEELSDDEKESQPFQAALRREKRKMVAGLKPKLEIVARPDFENERREVFKRLQKQGEIPSDAKYAYRLITKQQKRYMSWETYEEGMSGDERWTPTSGGPFTEKEEIQCAKCGHMSSSKKTFIDHICTFAVDYHFQQLDAMNQYHPRVDTENLTQPMLIALYGQKKPNRPPPSRFNRNEWFAPDNPYLQSKKTRRRTDSPRSERGNSPASDRLDESGDQRKSNSREASVGPQSTTSRPSAASEKRTSNQPLILESTLVSETSTAIRPSAKLPSQIMVEDPAPPASP